MYLYVYVCTHIQVMMALFQLGFITIFLSEPLISGYTTGAAVHVFTSQLQHITGLGETIRVTPGLFRIPRVRWNMGGMMCGREWRGVDASRWEGRRSVAEEQE